MATAKQIAFVLGLLNERDLDEEPREKLRKLFTERGDEVPHPEASKVINTLLSQPKLKRPAKSYLSPVSSYAIPVDELPLAELSFPLTDKTLLFVKHAEYRGTPYWRRLHGGGEDGRFNTTRLTASEIAALDALISKDPDRYGQLFSREYSVCARCHRSLTDDLSRETGYGPECRRLVLVTPRR